MSFVNIIQVVVLFFAIHTLCRSDSSKAPSFDHKINYTWTIDNWDSRRQLGEPLYSPKFAADTYKHVKWFLSFVFHENDAVDAFLNADAQNEEKTINAKFSLSFLNQNRETGYGLTTIHVFQIEPSVSNPLSNNWGWINFVFCNDDFANEFVSDNVLRVLLKLEFTVEDDRTFSAENEGDLHQTSLQYNGSQINDKNAQLLEDLLLKNHGCADVIITVDGREYPAHKVILASRSEVLADIIETVKPLKPNEPIRINIGNYSEEVIVEFFIYLYLGKSTPSVETADGALEIADKFKIDGLRNDTIEALSEMITPQNAINVFEIAHKNNAEYLKTKVVEYILSVSIDNSKVLCELCATEES